MRPEAHEFERAGIGKPVDQDEIRPQVTVTAIAPFPGKRMIEATARPRRVSRQKTHGLHKQGVELIREGPILTPVVPLKTISCI